MDPNLQQFREKDSFNPLFRYSLWAMIFSLLCSYVVGYMVPGINYIFAILLLLSGTFCLGGAVGGKRKDLCWVKIPDLEVWETRALRALYLVLDGGQLKVAPSSRIYTQKTQTNLLYIFDNMLIRTSFIDSDGIMRHLHFYVRFDTGLNLKFEHFLAFYSWYHDLHQAMPDKEAVFQRMRAQSAIDAPIFRIEFPANDSIPATTNG